MAREFVVEGRILPRGRWKKSRARTGRGRRVRHGLISRLPLANVSSISVVRVCGGGGGWGQGSSTGIWQVCAR